MDPAEVIAFAAAVEKLRLEPTLLLKPELKFFKDLLASTWGVRSFPQPSVAADPMQIDLSDAEECGIDGREAPAAQPAQQGGSAPARNVSAVSVAESIADSDEEDPQRLPEETVPFPSLPSCLDLDNEQNDAQEELCSRAKRAAVAAVDSGNVELAIEKYTQAIMTGGASALIYAKRAELLLTARRPCAAINDCSAALQMNPDCGKAYHVRGISNRRLGRWEAANRDFVQGQKLDYDESTAETLKLVGEKVKKIEKKRARQEAMAARKKARK